MQTTRTWADQIFDQLADGFLNSENSKDEALQVGSLDLQLTLSFASGADQVTRAFRPNLRLSESPGNVLSVYAMSTGELAELTPTTEHKGMLMPAGSASELDPESNRWRLETYRGALFGLDTTRQIGLAAYHGPIDHSELTAPMRQLFHWQVARLGGLLVHGAVVGTPRSAVLIVGSGGAGKSTTVCASLAAGLVTCGDDYVWVNGETNSGEFTAFQIYTTLKTRPAAAKHLPTEYLSAVPYHDSADGLRRLRYPAEGRPESLRESLPISAVVALTRGTSEGEGIREVSKRQALLVAAPSTAIQGSHDRSVGLARLKNLISQLPCYEVSLVDTPEEQGALMWELIHRLEGGAE